MSCSRLQSFIILYLCLFFHHRTVAGWSSSSTPISRRHALAKGLVLTTITITGGVHDAARAADPDKGSGNGSSNGRDERASSNDEDEDNRLERQREIRQRLLERRKLMQASRSSNDRQSYLDLSRQRAALYNTTSKAVSCPPNIPCY